MTPIGELSGRFRAPRGRALGASARSRLASSPITLLTETVARFLPRLRLGDIPQRVLVVKVGCRRGVEAGGRNRDCDRARRRRDARFDCVNRGWSNGHGYPHRAGKGIRSRSRIAEAQAQRGQVDLRLSCFSESAQLDKRYDIVVVEVTANFKETQDRLSRPRHRRIWRGCVNACVWQIGQVCVADRPRRCIPKLPRLTTTTTV
jgi:hypothetical protein